MTAPIAKLVRMRWHPPRARWRVLDGHPCLDIDGAQGVLSQRAPDIYIEPVSLGTRHQIVLAHSYYLESIHVIAIHPLYRYIPISI